MDTNTFPNSFLSNCLHGLLSIFLLTFYFTLLKFEESTCFSLYMHEACDAAVAIMSDDHIMVIDKNALDVGSYLSKKINTSDPFRRYFPKVKNENCNLRQHGLDLPFIRFV